MAGIVNLTKLQIAVDPETIPVLSAASKRPGTGSSSREAIAPGPPMPVRCARSSRDTSSTWRGGAPRIKKNLWRVQFVLLLRTIDLKRKAGKFLRKGLSPRQELIEVCEGTRLKCFRDN